MNDPHDRWQDDLVAYALGALDPAESDEMETHLEGCSSCRARLRWLQPAVETLPESVEQFEPPAALRERVMQTVRAETPVTTAAPAVTVPRRARLRRLVLSPAGAAAALLVVGAGAIGYAIHGSGGGGSGRTVASRGGATIVRDGDAATLTASKLPPLRRNHVYEVWLKHGSRMQPSTLFVPQHDGGAWVRIPHGIGDAEQMLVSSEPAGGSSRPSSAPIWAAPLP